jgi:cobalt-zinc-cadmium efflux system membrane fusion protein
MTSINRPLLYAGLLGATLMLAGCGEPEKTEAPRQQAAAPADPNLVKAGENLTRIIKLGEVTSAELSDTLRVAGQVDFDEQRITRIGATVTGRIIDLQATLGQQVKVGQTLAVLNSTELGAAQLAYMKARAQAQLNERRR